MHAWLAVTIALSTPQVVPARANRVTFYRAEQKIRAGWTKKQVQDLLGPPDEVLTPKTPGQPQYEMQTWRYGTRPNFELATLGQVTFDRHGKVDWAPAGSNPPLPMSVMSDEELQRHLEFLDNRAPWAGVHEDPRYFIRAANDLRPLGKEKALGVMIEGSRLGIQDDLFWLTRVLFVTRDPPGFFALPSIGGISPQPPKNLRRWPDFPMIVRQGVPYCMYQFALIFGFPEPFRQYARHNAKDWVMRSIELRPPDDPFPVMASTIRLARQKVALPGFPGDWVEQTISDQTLVLVGLPVTPEFPFDPEVVRKGYRNFLAAGGHWDRTQQAYVGRNGKPIAGN